MTPSDNESNSLLFEWKPQVPVRNTPDGITVSNLFKNTQTIEALPQITGNPLGDCTRFHGASGGLQFKLVPGDEGRVWFESLQDGKECKFAYVDEVYSSAARNVYIGILHPDLFSDGCMILASQLIRLNESGWQITLGETESSKYYWIKQGEKLLFVTKYNKILGAVEPPSEKDGHCYMRMSAVDYTENLAKAFVISAFILLNKPLGIGPYYPSSSERLQDWTLYYSV